MRGDLLTDNRPHGCIGVTKHKERESGVKIRTDVTKMLPPSFTLGNGHLFGVSSRSLGLTLRSMKIKKVDKP